jgi:outer membrane beta-barrel protein
MDCKINLNTKFLPIALALGLSLLSTSGFSEDIPFDQNVPDTTVDQGAPEQNPAPNVPPAAKAPPISTSNKAELNGVVDDSLEAPKLAAPSNNAKPNVANPTDPDKVPADLSGLGKLAPFSDIAVITKRYLPKTHRFEFTPNLGMIINDAFFNDFVIGGRLGFYFTENWGIELSALSISTGQRGVTNELQQDAVTTQSLLTPTSYYGLDVKWDPVYGKVGFLDEKIVPFDLYFSLGGGLTGTSGGNNAPTVHLGVGQLFAMSKWLAFRWDISWYGMNATSPVTNTSSFFTNLHATIGLSFFFPGASYR